MLNPRLMRPVSSLKALPIRTTLIDSLLRQFGVRWDRLEDGGTLTVALTNIGEDDSLIWPDCTLIPSSA